MSLDIASTRYPYTNLSITVDQLTNILNKYSPFDFRLHASDIHRNWYEHISNNSFSVTVKLPHIAILSAHCCSFHLLSFIASSVNRLSANFTKWSNTQTIRRLFADELFECVWPFCGICAYRVKKNPVWLNRKQILEICRRKKKTIQK